MKSVTVLSLLALAAAPISAWPWGRREYVPVPAGPYPYHHPKHHHTGGSTGFATGTIPPYPYSGTGGYYPTGTATGYFPTGTIGTVGTGVPSGYLPISPYPSRIYPPDVTPVIRKRANDIEKYRRRVPHGGPHTASYNGPESPYYPTATYGPTGGSGTGFHPYPTGTGFHPHPTGTGGYPFPTGTGPRPSHITGYPSLPVIIDPYPLA